MSLTNKAYDERKWHGLRRLAALMADTRLNDCHYPHSSAGYSMFEEITDLHELALLVVDNKDRLKYEDRDLMREVAELSKMLEGVSERFRMLSGHLLGRD